ncbi:MAG TPA: hypothetical protein VF899_03425 [Pyrinomonadaceae bacterium]
MVRSLPFDMVGQQRPGGIYELRSHTVEVVMLESVIPRGRLTLDQVEEIAKSLSEANMERAMS